MLLPHRCRSCPKKAAFDEDSGTPAPTLAPATPGCTSPPRSRVIPPRPPPLTRPLLPAVTSPPPGRSSHAAAWPGPAPPSRAPLVAPAAAPAAGRDPDPDPDPHRSCVKSSSNPDGPPPTRQPAHTPTVELPGSSGAPPPPPLLRSLLALVPTGPAHRSPDPASL